MALLLATPGRNIEGLRSELLARAPELDLRVWPELGNALAIDFAVVWRPPEELFVRLPALRAVSSLGAGVDGVLDHPGLPPSLPVGRLAGPRLAADMAGYLVAMVVGAWRGFDGFREARNMRRWRPYAPDRAPRIGLLGSGRMARAAARAFAALELEIMACNRSGGTLDGCQTRAGADGLAWVARQADFLINLLPLSDEQQKVVINSQMRGNVFFDHLMSLSVIRKGQDEIYER
ncbi:MAG: NAD(P)-dependent oxidoreductase, partial [Wenzhouxiangellaceae bacterium]